MSASRTMLLAALAIVLPTVIFASVVVAFNAYYGRLAVEAATLEQARRISQGVDAELARSAGALRVFATGRAISESDWKAARRRAAEIAALNGDWRSVTLLNLKTGAVLFTTDAPNVQPLSAAAFEGTWRPGDVTYGGIARRPGRCTCPLLGEQLTGANSDLALLLELDPAHILGIVRDSTPPGAVGALVDRRGLFIARTLDNDRRIGTPGTAYLRKAVSSGERKGLYRGRTYEGLANVTAFVRSPLTGWSAHVAVPSALITAPQERVYLAVALAALLAVAGAAATIWIMVRNLSDRRAAEVRLRDAQHLEALGQLTGGVAHDFNNMLAIIVGNIDLARRSPDLPPRVVRNLESAAQGAARAAELTRRMLAYARRQKLTPQVIDPCEVMRETGALLDRTIGDHIHLRCGPPSGAWPIKVDRSELENAIVNLAVNARDAMPSGGYIDIEALNMPAGTVVGGTTLPADMVAVRIKDSGEGIAPDIIDRVTDPFFTTKAPGRGTGLGLSQVIGFARQSGGDLLIHSTQGQGTTIHLLLPRHSAAAQSETESPTEAGDALPAGHIVLVEDEPMVLAATAEALEALGQTSSGFATGDAALAALRQGQACDMLLTDNQMPGLSGVDLIEQARALRPGLPAILMSALPPAEMRLNVPVLHKPFSPDQLRKALLSALARR